MILGGGHAFMNQRASVFGNETRLLDVASLCVYLSMGKNRATEFGEQCGAKRKFGKRTLYDKRVLDKALDKMTGEK